MNSNGFIVDEKTVWTKKKLKEDFFDDKRIQKIFCFFVINAVKSGRSSRGKSIKEYGWKNNVWKNSKGVNLKIRLLEVADLHISYNGYDPLTSKRIEKQNFYVAKKLDEMEKALICVGIKGNGFYKINDCNRIAVYNSEKNEMISVFDHIRNSLAHGRFYICNDSLIMESIVKNKGKCYLRGRMIVRINTLCEWIDIIKSGKLLND